MFFILYINNIIYAESHLPDGIKFHVTCQRSQTIITGGAKTNRKSNYFNVVISFVDENKKPANDFSIHTHNFWDCNV